MKIGFVFAGQGAQVVGMGKDLVEKFAIAAATFEKADKALGWSISDVCFNGPEDKLTETRYCQVAIYTMSAACLDVFKSLHPSIKPNVTAGLSLGEFSALYASGALSFEDGLKIIEKRANYMQAACEATKGSMASVMKGDLDLIKDCCCKCGTDIANINSSGQIVISGEVDKMTATIELIKANGTAKITPLKVAGAYHSRLMKTAEDKLKESIIAVKFSKPAVGVAQNYTGKIETEPEALKKNVVSQVTGSVQWLDCVNAMVDVGINTVIEFGPGSVLSGLIRRINPDITTVSVNNVETLTNVKLQNFNEGVNA